MLPPILSVHEDHVPEESMERSQILLVATPFTAMYSLLLKLAMAGAWLVVPLICAHAPQVPPLFFFRIKMLLVLAPFAAM